MGNDPSICRRGRARRQPHHDHDIDTLAPTMRLTEAMTLFVERGHAAMPVVDAERRLVGLLTEGDLLRVALR